MRHSSNRWYNDVTSRQTTPGGPCRTYLPYRLPDDSIAYVHEVGIHGQTADKGLKGLAKRVISGQTTLQARLPEGKEMELLSGIKVDRVPAELVDIVRNALSQNKTATTAVSTATSAPL